MTAKIKSFDSPDVDDLKSYSPDSESFCFLLTLMIGPATSEGAEIFDMKICSPQWLLTKCDGGILYPRHYLIIAEYDYERIVASLKKQIESLSAENWHNLALQIAKIARWEFEDYRPS